MTFRVPVGVFFVLVISAAATAVASACDDALALKLDQQIRQARAEKSWTAMNDAALRLAGLYDGCASGESGRRYFEDTLRMAKSLLSAGAAAVEGGSEENARRPFSVAQSLFSGLISALDTPSEIKDDARDSLAFLQKRFPWLVRIPVDPSVMPHARARAEDPPRPSIEAARPPLQPSNAPPATEFDVLESWLTPFAGPLQTLHVKLNLHPSTETVVAASDFRIVTTSRSNGRESVYGRSAAAPAYRKTDWSSSTNQYRLIPTVDPSEDLGALGSFRLRAGDSVTRVVTFVVRSDVELIPETIASLSWHHR